MHTQDSGTSARRDTIVIGADVGHGTVKYSWSRLNQDDDPQFRVRPAGVGVMEELQAKIGGVEAADGMYVMEDGKVWAVFRHWGEFRRTRRLLNADYPTSPQYRALVKGVFAEIGVRDESVVLVLGTPVSESGTGAKIIQRFTGEQEITAANSVHVERTLVLPQPAGAFYQAMADRIIPTDPSSSDGRPWLIIDVGTYSLDYLLVGRGYRIQAEASWSSNYASRVLIQRLAQLCSQNGDRIDGTTLECEFLRSYATRTDSHAVGVARQYLHREAQALAETIHSEITAALLSCGTAVQQVLITGGGATLIGEQLKNLFEHDRATVHIVNDPIMANARGFLMYGLMRAQKAAAA